MDITIGYEFTLSDLFRIIRTPEILITFLFANHLIAKKSFCQICISTEMELCTDNSKELKKYWKCPRCNAKLSLLSNSFFAKAHLKITEIFHILYQWSSNINATTCSQAVGVSYMTVVQWYQFIREICSLKLIDNNKPLGGPGIIVQIDECQLVKAKNNKGRLYWLYKNAKESDPDNFLVAKLEMQQDIQNCPGWIFGIRDTVTKRTHIEFVNKRDGKTLIPIIENHVLPGSIIQHDCWGAYNGFNRMPFPQPYLHHSVNHSKHFRDPQTGLHTNFIEERWSKLRRKFKAMMGTYRDFVPSYVDEFMWRESYGGKFSSNTATTFKSLLSDIANQYQFPQEKPLFLDVIVPNIIFKSVCFQQHKPVISHPHEPVTFQCVEPVTQRHEPVTQQRHEPVTQQCHAPKYILLL